jgi:DNA-binding GntR family transcriptional regulator
VRYADHGGVGQLRVGDQRWQSHRLGLKSHRQVADLIETRDVAGAVSHWRLHLTNAT